MRKFFEKHDLFKLTSIVLLLAVLLSWLVSYSYYQSGTLVASDISRAGLFDLLTYPTLGIYYFPLLFMFVIITSGFYKFLESIDAYDTLTSKIANKLVGKEKIVAVISIIIFAALAGVVSDILVLFAFIPFVISVFSKLKIDKVTGFASTFVAVLVGSLCATYSGTITKTLVDNLAVTYGYDLISLIILFAIGSLLLSYFVCSRINKVKNDKEVALLVDPFAKTKVEETKTKKSKKVNKVSTLGLIILLVVSAIVVLLSFIDWENVFGITIFSESFEWLSKATLFGHPVYSYILGIHDTTSGINSFISAFGSWDLITVAVFFVIIAFIIKLVYHIPFDKMLDEFIEGYKISNKTVFILLVINSVLLVSVFFPTMPAISDKILKTFGTNIGSLFASSAITSIFAVDFYYVVSMIGSVFNNYSNLNVAALILQTSYGFIQFIAPTSIVLMLGLSHLDVKFKDYFKFIWKFLLAMLVVIIIVIIILMYL